MTTHPMSESPAQPFESTKSRLVDVLCLALLTLGCAYATLFCASALDVAGHAIGADDSYISYRYAQNLVDGHGLVFNPGVRVEGFTNLLYVLIMALPLLLHWDVYLFSVFFNTVLVAATLLVLLKHWRAASGERTALLGGLLFALSPSIWLWASSGLETSLVLFLQVCAWILVERVCNGSSTRSLGALCVVLSTLALTRADGFVTAAIVLAFLLVKRRFRPALITGSVVGCVVAGLFTWRLAYYHELLPNTYYAKVSGSLFQRLWSSIRELGGISARQGMALYVLSVVFALLSRRWHASGIQKVIETLSFELFFTVAWLSYWLYGGGDNFEDRFLIVLIPIGITILMLEVLQASVENLRLFVACCACVVQLSVPVRDAQYGKHLLPKYDYRILIGRFVGEHWPGQLLATPAAGKIPYFSRLQTIDMLGLTDHFLARIPPKNFAVGHSKEDSSYVLSRNPDVIATVFYGDGLDLGAEFGQRKYENAGYRVHYLVNSTTESRAGKNIIDVLGRSAADIIVLSHLGWRAVVLDRNPERQTKASSR